MAGEESEGIRERGAGEEFVYRISTTLEWEEFKKSGFSYGGELDRSCGFIHLSRLNQVQSVLQNFYSDTKFQLYLLQIDANKLGDGLVYEIVDGSNSFPHFYGPSRSYNPLPLEAIVKAEKLSSSGGRFHCPMIDSVDSI